MSINYLKKAAKTPETETSTAQQVVTEMLANIEKNGESAVQEYAAKLDKWSGDIVMSESTINKILADVPDSVKRDIDFAVKQVFDFALAQKKSISDLFRISFDQDSWWIYEWVAFSNHLWHGIVIFE